ncbi:MAG: hypothetical protein JJV98_01285 [Desulfosarcina sp.]|nr:hypothetical protein [Desulfobacterales bacterium]
MKSVLIDTSSAILLFKSGWFDATLDHYRLRTGRAAVRELTVPGYPGAAFFQGLVEQGRIDVLPAAAGPETRDPDLAGMGPGERECIQHYLTGAGQFILMDDGRGATYCRDNNIPYVNALLMPRILALADPVIARQGVSGAMAQIYRLGRYAPWILDFARDCADEVLTPFRP